MKPLPRALVVTGIVVSALTVLFVLAIFRPGGELKPLRERPALDFDEPAPREFRKP